MDGVSVIFVKLQYHTWQNAFGAIQKLPFRSKLVWAGKLFLYASMFKGLWSRIWTDYQSCTFWRIVASRAIFEKIITEIPWKYCFIFLMKFPYKFNEKFIYYEFIEMKLILKNWIQSESCVVTLCYVIQFFFLQISIWIFHETVEPQAIETWIIFYVLSKKSSYSSNRTGDFFTTEWAV